MSVRLKRRKVRDASGWLLTPKNRTELESICGTPVESATTYDEAVENAIYYLVVCHSGVDELFQKSESEYAGIVSALRMVFGEDVYSDIVKEVKRRLDELKSKAGTQVSDSATGALSSLKKFLEHAVEDVSKVDLKTARDWDDRLVEEDDINPFDWDDYCQLVSLMDMFYNFLWNDKNLEKAEKYGKMALSQLDKMGVK